MTRDMRVCIEAVQRGDDDRIGGVVDPGRVSLHVVAATPAATPMSDAGDPNASVRVLETLQLSYACVVGGVMQAQCKHNHSARAHPDFVLCARGCWGCDRYHIGWPLTEIVDSKAQAAYSSVLTLLTQVRRVKWELDHLHHSLRHRITGIHDTLERANPPS